MPPPMGRRGRSIAINQQMQASNDQSPESELLSQLEKSRQEYDHLKLQREKLERSKQEQHLEATIEMRETIELLKEESLMKNELLTKYEREQKKADDEVSNPNNSLKNILYLAGDLLQEAESRLDEKTGRVREPDEQKPR